MDGDKGRQSCVFRSTYAISSHLVDEKVGMLGCEVSAVDTQLRSKPKTHIRPRSSKENKSFSIYL